MLERRGLNKTNFQSGRNLFHAVACASCHRFDGEGGDIGPDLTSVRNKFAMRDLMEAIIEPSKIISDQYGSFTVTLKDGESHTGLVSRHEGKVTVHTSDHTAKPIEVPESQVKSVQQVPVSQMPPGLVYALSEDELRDLVAYLMSQGNPKDKMFRK